MRCSLSLKSAALTSLLGVLLFACASGSRPHWQVCDERALEKGYTLDDLYTGSTSNEDSGYGNRIYGRGNKVSGDDNCVIGDENEIRGNRNRVTGNRNKT